MTACSPAPRRLTPLILCFLVAASGAWLAAPARPAGETVSGVDLLRTVEVGGRPLSLVSCGTREVLWADIFVAALYLPSGGEPGAGISAVGNPDRPKAVNLTVLDGGTMPDRIPEKYRAALRRSVSAETWRAVRRHLSGLADGDSVWLTYAPNQGVTISLNGAIIATAPGHATVDAVLAAWSGEEDWPAKLRDLMSRHPC